MTTDNNNTMITIGNYLNNLASCCLWHIPRRNLTIQKVQQNFRILIISGQARTTTSQRKMTGKSQNITFHKHDKDDRIPYELLLLADPSKELIDEYLKKSDVFSARRNDDILGVVVLFPLTAETAEIKNVAVKPEFQGKGIGSFLIENAVKVALLDGQKSICIGTANSSVGQFYLYQKLGFELTDIKRFFFTDNYAEPIYENGIQAKHMLLLTRQLSQ